MLDSRNKIVDLTAALGSVSGKRAVLACCDPLLPAHVARLKEFAAGGKLVIVIDASIPAYLDANARAALAAALDCVETVIVGDRAAADELGADELLDLSAEEAAWREAFFSLVRKKGS